MTVDIPPAIGWRREGTYTGRPAPEPETETMWRDCPTCWAAGRIYEQHYDGWTMELCPTCMGVRQVMS